MLAAVGVTLRLPKRLLRRCAALRGLNAHERRLQRRRWRDADRSERADAAALCAGWRAEAEAAEAAEEGLRQRRAELLEAAARAAARRARLRGAAWALEPPTARATAQVQQLAVRATGGEQGAAGRAPGEARHRPEVPLPAATQASGSMGPVRRTASA